MRRGAGLRAGEGTRFYLALAVITLVALWLRLWAIDFGVPMVTHPDEPNILNPALHMIRTHDFNPHWFIYPALIIYIEAGVVALVQALGHVVSLTAGQVVSAEYVGGRLIMAASGIATVPLVGLIARRMAPGGAIWPGWSRPASWPSPTCTSRTRTTSSRTSRPPSSPR